MGSSELKEFLGDMHIHTCLSPCADLEMSPRRIVAAAKRKGLHFIGICDHNSAENVLAAMRVAKSEGIGFIGGMEITSQEEVHILALFDEYGKLLSLQEIIYRNLHGTNDERLYGDQVIVDEEDEVIGFNKKLLIGATDIPIHEVVNIIHQLNGLAIASHVEREGFGIIGQLGFIPEGLALDAVEITCPSKSYGISLAKDFTVIGSSDAHVLEDIGRTCTRFLLKEINIEELRKSFNKEAGRRVIL